MENIYLHKVFLWRLKKQEFQVKHHIQSRLTQQKSSDVKILLKVLIKHKETYCEPQFDFQKELAHRI